MSETRTVDLNKFKGAVGFTATFSSWGNTRKANLSKIKASTDTADDTAAKQRMKLSKVLIVSKEYDAIRSFMQELRAWIYTRTVPSFFKEGFQLCGVDGISAIEDRMRKAIRLELPNLIENFIEVYPEQIKEARGILEPVGQFEISDYPGTEEMKRFFNINYNWIAFTVPDQLPVELRQQEEEKLKRQMSDAGDKITEALRQGFADLIAHATDRLTVKAGEKPKVFRDSMLGNITDFLETFNSRNLMGDVELAKLVAQAGKVLAGVTPQKLRDDAGSRENVLAQFAQIQSTVSGMIQDKPTRTFEFDEPETAAPVAEEAKPEPTAQLSLV